MIGKYDAEDAVMRYSTKDRSPHEWAIVEPAPFTASGFNEVVEYTHTKKEGQARAQELYRTKKWRKRCAVVKSSSLNMAPPEPPKPTKPKKAAKVKKDKEPPV